MLYSLLALKPILDMMWKIKILDIIFILFIMIYYFKLYYKKKIKIDTLDLLIVFLALLIFRSLLKGINSESIIIFLKMYLNLLFYFIGKKIINYKKLEIKFLKAFEIVIFVNLLFLVTQKGFIYWGNVNTFKGPYYYKTDCAIALSEAFIFLRFYLISKVGKNRIKGFVSLFLFIPLTLFLANSRAFLAIYLLVIFIFIFCEYYSKLSLKKVFFITSNIVISFFIFIIFKFEFIKINFKKYLTIDFSNFFSEKNLQGRNIIWEGIYNKFTQSNLFDRLFGVNLYGDKLQTAFFKNGVHSHSIYLKLLFSTGYIGLSIYIMIQIIILIEVRKIDDKQLKYTVIYLFLIYNISGIVQHHIAFTQLSFFYFLYLGILKENNNKHYLLKA